MRRITLIALLVVTLLVGSSTFTLPVAEAGSNGQQLWFKPLPSGGTIKWIRIYGKNHLGQQAQFFKEFNPPVSEYGLTNWWWVGQISVDYVGVYPNKNTYNGCSLDVPKSMSGDWVRIYLDVRTSWPGCERR